MAISTMTPVLQRRTMTSPEKNGVRSVVGIKKEAEELRKRGASYRQIAGALEISHEWARVLCRGVAKGTSVTLRISRPTNTLDDALELLARDFAVHCRRLRKILKKTQSQFGEMMQVSNTNVAISRWESGKHVPTKKYLRRFLELQKMVDSKKTSSRKESKIGR